MRTALADTLIELEGTNDRILWLDADLMASSGMNRFKAAYPDKVINCGIQEANMFGVATGLSEEGFIPFVHSFGAFASRRIADQIFMSGVYARQDVRIVGSDPGISAGPNGGTHISLEDIGILRSLPGTIILEPVSYTHLVPMGNWTRRRDRRLPGQRGFCLSRIWLVSGRRSWTHMPKGFILGWA